MDRTGKEIWEAWLKDIEDNSTWSYNPNGIIYARDCIAELEAELAEIKSEEEIHNTILQAENAKLVQRVGVLENAISSHNQECRETCKMTDCGYGYGRRTCPSCPMDWTIEAALEGGGNNA